MTTATIPAATATLSFTLNGKGVSVPMAPGETLLEILRHRLRTTSVKDACAPQGQCGACLVLIDGMPKTACATPAAKVAGRDVLTVEGISAEERQLYADAFQIAAGHQCGFCTPGMLIRIKHLVDSEEAPTRAEIAKALDGHVCRCTGYVKILDAVELILRAKRGEPLPGMETDGGVGARIVRFKGGEQVLGDRPFVDDLQVPGLLHGAVALSPVARGRVIRIDTAKAEALPGVVRVVTAKDVPGERWYGLIYKDWPGFVAEGEEVRYVGDVLAAVAADDMRTAREAVKLIEVEIEPLPPVLDPVDALKPGAPQVNPKHDNLLSATEFSRGDVEAALAASAHVVSGTWKTQRIEHLFLEPESALAMPREDGVLHVYSQGQGVFDDRDQIAAFLNLPKDKVHVELVPNGGAFGGKEDLSIQARAALLAHVTAKPVRITLNREESVRMHPKRHPIEMTYTVGCDAEGRLTALKAEMLGDSGAYASVGGKVLERAAGHSCGPYRVPSVHVKATAAYTNNPPCGAMRGFGANQASFAIEGCMDLLAEKTGLDPWEIRWRNAVEVGDLFVTGQILEKSVGIKKTLAAVKDAYYAARAAGKAVGIGCGVKNSGLGNGAKEWGKSRLVVAGDGTLPLYLNFTEMGQGLLTIATQCAAEVTGLPASLFRPRVDTTHELGAGQTTGSRATLLAGRSVAAAAAKLKADLDQGKTLAQLAGTVYAGDIVIDDTTAPGMAPPGKIKTHTAFGFATQVVILDEAGKLEKVIAAHDVGRAINPQQCEGQIEGAVHMGLGYALTEELPCRNGMPVTFKMREIGALRAQHMPEVEVILIEDPEPEGPFGAKGVGEIGLVPTAGAVAGAIAAFEGTRHMTLPMKTSAPAKAINVGRIAAKDRENWR
jgi:selenium-dependent xanthine dehydrogenase